DNCASADALGKRTSFAFTGSCPSQPALGAVPLASVAKYMVDYAAGSHWDNASSRGRAPLVADGQPGDHTLEFKGYPHWSAEDGCGLNPVAEYHFGRGGSLTAETCTATTEPLYQKRRLPQRDQYKVAAYPRSYRDTDGTTYVLFATPPGGFGPAGKMGC